MDRSTNRRVPLTQPWPLTLMAPARPRRAAWLKSASANTITADLPPSSSPQGFKVSAAVRSTFFAVAPLPTNWILSMPGCATMASPTSGPPATVLTTPGGNPASRNSSPSRMTAKGASSGAFNIDAVARSQRRRRHHRRRKQRPVPGNDGADDTVGFVGNIIVCGTRPAAERLAPNLVGPAGKVAELLRGIRRDVRSHHDGRAILQRG